MQFLTNSINTEQSIPGVKHPRPEQLIPGENEKTKKVEKSNSPLQNGRMAKGQIKEFLNGTQLK